MKKKLLILSAISLLPALLIFIFSYTMYHYLGPDGLWYAEWHPTPRKPYVTLLFAIWGVMFLFSSVMSALIAFIFFPKKQKIKRCFYESNSK